MKKSIFAFCFLLFATFLQAQEITYEKSGFEVVDDSTYYHIDTIYYVNGNIDIRKRLVGDSLIYIAKLFKKQLWRQKTRADNQRFALEKMGLSEHARILEELTGDTYYKHSTERFTSNFTDNWKIKYDGIIYDAVSAKVGDVLKFQAVGLGLYTLYPLSKNSFVLLNFFEVGEHLEMFLTDEDDGKRLFFNETGTVAIRSE